MFHHILTGHTGRIGYEPCTGVPSMGDFHYMQTKYNGYTRIHVDSDYLKIKIMGVDP